MQPDGWWSGKCLDGCNRLVLVLSPDGKWQKSSNVGHYIGRGNHSLRYDEENCNLQSAYCNAWRDKIDMLAGYKKGLDLKYGEGTSDKLESQGEEIHTWRKVDLLQIIEDSKTAIDYMLKHGVY